MSAPTNVRTEATARGQTMTRWSYAGSNDIELYRSTDGVSYSAVATLSADTISYADTGLSDKTKYWYKLSDDGGATFSAVVTVVTYVVSSRRAGKSGFAPGAAGLNVDPSYQLNEEINNKHLKSDPCELCVVDGALVVDCTSGCDWFRVVLDQDVNSISLVGCDDCPEIDFIIPPDETRGICGWPAGCDYAGDECFEGRVPGGPNGRTAKTGGLSYDGYGPSPQTITGCPCTSPVGGISIACCSANCVLDCDSNPSVQLRVCGGIHPYTWSATGNIRLSSTRGPKVTVTLNGTLGVFPHEIAFVDVYEGIYSTADPCDAAAVISHQWVGYDCDGASFNTDLLGVADTITKTINADDCSCSNPATASSTVSDSAQIFGACGTNPKTGTVRIQWAARGVDHTTPTLTLPDNTNLATGFLFEAGVDLRSPAMIAGGCGCDPTDATVTVTDRTGRSVTVVVG